jgi:hypothetical protein
MDQDPRRSRRAKKTSARHPEASASFKPQQSSTLPTMKKEKKIYTSTPSGPHSETEEIEDPQPGAEQIFMGPGRTHKDAVDEYIQNAQETKQKREEITSELNEFIKEAEQDRRKKKFREDPLPSLRIKTKLTTSLKDINGKLTGALLHLSRLNTLQKDIAEDIERMMDQIIELTNSQRELTNKRDRMDELDFDLDKRSITTTEQEKEGIQRL